MSEAAFARTFLGTLDSRPIKLSVDHVEDPKTFPARPPYILGRMPKAMSKPTTLAPGQERSVSVTLKSLRNPPVNVKLTSQALHTSVLDIKNQVSSQTRIPVDKLRVLHNKRPLMDSKVLKDVVCENDQSVEMALMVVGGAAAIEPEAQPADTAETRSGSIGVELVETDAFWADLHGFLMQRLKDEKEAEKLHKMFKSSWESSKAQP